ncbi:hypothetical protein ACFFGH_20900 [Lysobacter korlensis]|uniref:SbsA Ig-like domain-containing protein n=1 Tax=Lysobacter korlensis TaxID=553636 RepID=A0ABV6RTJ2_9GAMM
MTVTSDDSTVTIRFDEMLAYAADYTVTVDAATAATGARSTLRYTFQTPDASVFSLVRSGAGQDDRIFRRQVAGGDATEVFAAPAIQEYAVVGDQLAVVTIGAGQTSTLQMKPVAGGAAAGITLPAAGTVTQLAASGASNLLGFIFTPERVGDTTPARTLIVYDAESGSGVGREVLGIDGTPLRVVDWTFVPSSTSVVAQAADANLYLIDVLAGDPPVALGQHQELRNFIPGTRTLTVADANGATAIDLDTGEKTPLSLPSDGSTEDDSAGQVIILGEDRYLETLMTPEYRPGVTRLNPRVLHVDDSGPRVLYEPATADTDIRSMCLSPNGRQLAVELLPGDRQPDGYPYEPASTGITTVLIDVATGSTVGGMNGFMPSWC